ncbi:MAG: hypothetical protein OEV22_13060 [Deltaproteobacteria bacterium]|jgi:hypothetical protein|nr:hypothetical protein [Deltaproteobacteria bacterium]
MRSRDYHLIPPAITYSSTLGGRRDVKFYTFFPTYSASGPAKFNEGQTGTYNFFTDDSDGTYNFNTTPASRMSPESGTFSVTSGLGTFELSGFSNAVEDDTANITVEFKNVANDTVLTTIVTELSDTTEGGEPVADWVSFQEGVASYAGTSDTYVQSGANESTNRGSDATVITDKNASNERFGLTKFGSIEDAFTDNTAVTVTSASIEIDITAEGQGMALHTMLLSWTESTTWTSGNGAGTFDGGTGYMLSSLGSWPGDNNFTGKIEIVLDSQTVQDWINTPASNLGMWMIGTHPTDGQQHSSAEATTSTDRPKLQIAYTE